MANDISTNPWTLDTVTTGTIWPSNVYVDHFEMIDYTLDTDTVQLRNGSGKVVWEANGASDLQEVRSGRVGTCFNGLYMSASSNAATRVRVYLGRPGV
jgi:hypothetical protein